MSSARFIGKVSKHSALTSTETVAFIKDGEKGVCVCGGGGGGGGGQRRVYTYRYTVTTRMTPALRWAAVRVILMFIVKVRKSDKTVSTDHNI